MYLETDSKTKNSSSNKNNQEKQPSFIKYRSHRLRFPNLKVIVNNLNEIWSVDLAFVDKLAKYNLVAVDYLSRYLRIEPLKTKYATETLGRGFQKDDQTFATWKSLGR